jgi:hypothetical protein
MDYHDSGAGVARDSLAYFHDHIGSLAPIIVADIHDAGEDWPNPYHLILHDRSGNRMALSGCAAGTFGEPAREAVRVLIESGFDAIQARRALAEAPLQLTRQEVSPTYPCAAAAHSHASPSRGRPIFPRRLR